MLGALGSRSQCIAWVDWREGGSLATFKGDLGVCCFWHVDVMESLRL